MLRVIKLKFVFKCFKKHKKSIWIYAFEEQMIFTKSLTSKTISLDTLCNMAWFLIFYAQNV